mgnify:FL=1
MKIIFNEISRPAVQVTRPLADFNWKSIETSKTITVDWYFKSKTRVSTTLRNGELAIKINLEVDNFKQDCIEEGNMWSNDRYEAYYFKKSKKQNFEVYKEYLKVLIAKVFEIRNVKVDVLTVNIYKPSYQWD